MRIKSTLSGGGHAGGIARVHRSGANGIDVGRHPFAALKIGAGVRVSARVVLKLVHAERHNTREPSPRDPLDSRRDTLTTLSLEVALF